MNNRQVQTRVSSVLAIVHLEPSLDLRGFLFLEFTFDDNNFVNCQTEVSNPMTLAGPELGVDIKQIISGVWYKGLVWFSGDVCTGVRGHYEITQTSVIADGG